VSASDAALSTARVTVVAHLPRYAWTARALHEAGLLAQYVPMPLSTSGVGLLARVPGVRHVPAAEGVPRRTLWATAAVTGVGRIVDPVLRARDRVLELEASRHVGGVDVVHVVHGVGPRVLRAARAAGALVVLDVRALHPRVRQRLVAGVLDARGIAYELPFQDRIESILEEVELADVVVANSNLTKRSFVEAGVSKPIVVVHPGVEPPEREVPRPHDPSMHRILFVGRQADAKGLHDLADAAHALDEGTSIRVVGPPMDDVQPLFDPTPATVEAFGNLPHDQLEHQYAWADVLVHPSLADGFGLSVLEAMGHGTPAIVSDCSGVAELLTHGEDGWVVPGGDPEALGRCLTEALADPQRLAAVGAAAEATAARHGFDRYAEDLLAAYRSNILRRLA
jgi:glycosyltransferase involved in cell wall biosynthesis